MNIFKRRRMEPPKPPRVTIIGDFSIGQVVQHKLDGVRFVIISFSEDERGETAWCAASSKVDDLYEIHLAELIPAALQAQEPT